MHAVNDPDDLLLKPIVDRSSSILTLDIETSPNIAAAFGVWNQNLRPENIIHPSRILMVGYKWYGHKTAQVLSERTLSHDELVRQSWQLVDQADILVHYNGIKFDVRHMRREWLLAGLAPPSPFKQVDLLRVVRKQFAFNHNKLDAIAKETGVGAKIEHSGLRLWLACLEGDERAFRDMERYCKRDVLITEGEYDRLRPWITAHPHITTTDELRCNKCGSPDLEPLPKEYRAVVNAYRQYRCQSCGGLVRASYSKRVAQTRGVQ